MDPEKYLVKLSLGKSLSPEELEEVLSVLKEITPGGTGVLQFADDVYSAIVVLGKADAREHRHLIAKHLDGNDPQTVSLILEVLCLQWGLREDYIEWVFRFAVGVSWDHEEDVRKTAIKILGEYLRERFAQARGVSEGSRGRPARPNVSVTSSGDTASETQSVSEPWQERNRELLDLLWSIFDDEETDGFTRQSAYSALLRIGGRPWEETPSELHLLDLSPDSKEIDRSALRDLVDSIAG